MPIEPTNLPPVLPGTTSPVTGSSPVDTAARELNAGSDAIQAQRPDPSTVEARAGRTVDPGEQQVGADPWDAVGASSRMLSGPISADIGQQGAALRDVSLHDAVRGAVNLVFADGG